MTQDMDFASLSSRIKLRQNSITKVTVTNHQSDSVPISGYTMTFNENGFLTKYYKQFFENGKLVKERLDESRFYEPKANMWFCEVMKRQGDQELEVVDSYYLEVVATDDLGWEERYYHSLEKSNYSILKLEKFIIKDGLWEDMHCVREVTIANQQKTVKMARYTFRDVLQFQFTENYFDDINTQESQYYVIVNNGFEGNLEATEESSFRLLKLDQGLSGERFPLSLDGTDSTGNEIYTTLSSYHRVAPLKVEDVPGLFWNCELDINYNANGLIESLRKVNYWEERVGATTYRLKGDLLSRPDYNPEDDQLITTVYYY